MSRLEIRGGGHLLLSPSELWLLLVFVAGVLVLLFGASARIGLGLRGQGAREGLERLRARADALERTRKGAPEAVPDEAEGRTDDAAEGRVATDGILATGGWLLVVYLAGWMVLG